MERRYERQRLGLEPAPIADGIDTGADLVEGWMETYLKHKPSHEHAVYTLRKHLLAPPLGTLNLAEVSAGKIDLFLTAKHAEISPATINHLRAYLSRAFTLG